MFILDIMNFQWFNIELFGVKIDEGRFGHSSEIVENKLYIFGEFNYEN